MNAWTATPTTAPDRAELACLTGLVGQIGDDAFAQRGLESLNQVLHAASWSVYQVWAERPPCLHLSASCGVADTTLDCFAAYHAGLYRRDRSFDLVRRSRRAGQATVLRMGADEAPNAEHRESIYRSHGVVERLSVAQLEDDGSLFAVNLYHHEHQGAFDPLELERFGRIAPLLLAGVRRHIALQHDALRAGPPRGEAVRDALRARCPLLTERELDVCERLLRGWSYDGTAADLGLTPATVKTYRARAFARLGLHFRSELFALLGNRR
jgi:DNA-binding CsgD family transcriptional regulator